MSSQANLSFAELRQSYLASSTIGMPIAGMVVWAALGLVALRVQGELLFLIALIATGMVFPVSMLVDRIRGAPGILAQNGTNPLMQIFLRMILLMALLIPLVIIAAQTTGEFDLVVLGLAILTGIVWIPHGWAANDPSGLIHMIVRALGCYAAFLLVPEPFRATAICAVVVLCYVYTLIAMKRPGDTA